MHITHPTSVLYLPSLWSSKFRTQYANLIVTPLSLTQQDTDDWSAFLHLSSWAVHLTCLSFTNYYEVKWDNTRSLLRIMSASAQLLFPPWLPLSELSILSLGPHRIAKFVSLQFVLFLASHIKSVNSHQLFWIWFQVITL